MQLCPEFTLYVDFYRPFQPLKLLINLVRIRFCFSGLKGAFHPVLKNKMPDEFDHLATITEYRPTTITKSR